MISWRLWPDILQNFTKSHPQCMVMTYNMQSFVLIFHLLARKPNLEQILFIQKYSFIIFTCLNPVLLVQGFGQV
jgi:hypothetical protein